MSHLTFEIIDLTNELANEKLRDSFETASQCINFIISQQLNAEAIESSKSDSLRTELEYRLTNVKLLECPWLYAKVKVSTQECSTKDYFHEICQRLYEEFPYVCKRDIDIIVEQILMECPEDSDVMEMLSVLPKYYQTKMENDQPLYYERRINLEIAERCVTNVQDFVQLALGTMDSYALASNGIVTASPEDTSI